MDGSLSMRVTNDRRRKPRVRLAGAAVVHGDTSPITCECIDLASGGVGLRSPIKIKKGRKVGVVLSLGDRSVTLHAVVKRCRAQGKDWSLGLQFTRMDPESATLLDGFVEGAMHRDVRLYQAQVFLARTGARSLEEALGAKGPLQGGSAPAKAKHAPPAAPQPAPVDEAEGSAPITLDEPARTSAAAARDREAGPSEREATGPWSPASPPADPRAARTQTNSWTPAPPEASAGLRHAVATALHDVSSDLGDATAARPSWPSKPEPAPWPRGDFGDAPPKGGTMIQRNPLLDESGAAGFSADVSALEYDDGLGSDGRTGRRTTVVDPRTLAARSPGARPPPLRVERAAPSDAASFQPRIADLDLDDAPTRMYAEAPSRPAADPSVKRRSLRGETQIGPSPSAEEPPRRLDTLPSPFGGGRVREVAAPPSAISTLVSAQAPVDAPTPIPIPGRNEMRAPPATVQTGATQVAIPAPRTMPYGPVRGEATQVAFPAQGLPLAPTDREDATGSGGPRPPSPFGGREAPPPSPFASGRAADERGPEVPGHRRPIAGPRRDHALDEEATRLRSHPMRAADRGSADAARTDAANEEDTAFAAQYGRALSDLDLESR